MSNVHDYSRDVAKFQIHRQTVSYALHSFDIFIIDKSNGLKGPKIGNTGCGWCVVVWWCGGVVVWWCGGVVVWWCGGVVVWVCGGVW